MRRLIARTPGERGKASGPYQDCGAGTAHDGRVPAPLEAGLRRMHLRSALSEVAESATLPFGYSLGVFSTGQLVARRHGPPSLLELLLYALGAVVAYAGLRAVAGDDGGRSRRRGESRGDPRALTTAAAHAATIAGAIGGAALAARVPGMAAWPLGGLAFTAIYLVGSALERTIRRAVGAPGRERGGAKATARS